MQEHQRLTGKPNAVILNNAQIAVRTGANVQFRMPLIPGLNNSDENIKMTAEFIRGLQGDEASIELMPYHRLGVGKYRALGIDYPLEGLESAKTEEVESVRQSFETHRVRCLVSM